LTFLGVGVGVAVGVLVAGFAIVTVAAGFLMMTGATVFAGVTEDVVWTLDLTGVVLDIVGGGGMVASSRPQDIKSSKPARSNTICFGTNISINLINNEKSRQLRWPVD
jgi:hypothetical protein